MKVYVLHDCDDWKERHYVAGVFSSIEKAVAHIAEHYPNYSRHKRWNDQWVESDDTGYLYISEHELDTGEGE